MIKMTDPAERPPGDLVELDGLPQAAEELTQK